MIGTSDQSSWLAQAWKILLLLLALLAVCVKTSSLCMTLIALQQMLCQVQA